MVLGALAALGWFVWLPSYRPDLRDGEVYGIDVSHHQGSIDWDAVAGDDIEVVYVKATEGGDHVDTGFEAHWRGAADAGLLRGAYHFFTLCRPGAEQAEHLLDTLPAGDPGELPVAVDLELAGNCAERPSRRAVLREIEAFLAHVEAATDREVVLYLGDDFEGRYDVRDELDRPLWHPRFLRRPDVDGWVVWQVMGWASVDGVDGDVDLDVVDLEVLRAT